MNELIYISNESSTKYCRTDSITVNVKPGCSTVIYCDDERKFKPQKIDDPHDLDKNFPNELIWTF